MILEDQISLTKFNFLGYDYLIFNFLITLQHTKNCISCNMQGHPALLHLDQCHRWSAIALGEKERGLKIIEQIDQLIALQKTPLKQLLLINQINTLCGLWIVYDHQKAYKN